MEKPKKPRRTVILLLLLALLCIGAAELTATYFFNPPLYRQLTEPVRRAGRAALSATQAAAQYLAEAASACGGYAAQRLSDLGSACAAWWEEITAPPEPELPDIQEASEPDLPLDDLTQDPAITQLEIRDGTEFLTGGIVPVVYYNQGEEPWASRKYGSDPFSGYGCGPAVMAMAVSSMTEYDINPDQMGQWAVSHGHWAKRGGSYLSLIQGAAEAHGLTAESLSQRTPMAVLEALLNDHMLVALMGPGHFTKGGHFILIRGVTLSGAVLVADPNSSERSLVEWDPQLILDELSTSTSDGAPLWVLAPSTSED